MNRFSGIPFRVSIAAVLLLVLGACSERRSDDPIQSYRLWSGQAPAKDVNVVHGKYWQSAHWTKEYILYLELEVPPEWRNEFIRQNELVEADSQWASPADVPGWFDPPETFRVWKSSKLNRDSRVFEDSTTGHMFIYDIQL